MEMIFIFLGGAIGACFRYMCSMWFGSRAGTVLVNGVGSLGLGFAAALAAKYDINVSSALTVGFFGALTTFSTFSLETTQLLFDKRYVYAIAYVTVSITGSICLFLLGYYVL